MPYSSFLLSSLSRAPRRLARLVVLGAALHVPAGCDGSAGTGGAGGDGGAAGTGGDGCSPGELLRDDGACQPAGLPPDMPCPPGELLRDDGACQPAGLSPDMPCPPGETLSMDGACQSAGVPASECGEGFVPDGDDGCEPVLPGTACPPGQMAIPGEPDCHDVAPCADGTWGGIPAEPGTQFVDNSYPGNDSDGSEAHPWTSVSQAIAAAAPDAIVAVAAGTYVEDVLVQGKPVRLWGRCPALVEIAGTNAQPASLQVLDPAASGTAVRGLSITGPARGIALRDAASVTFEEVRIHDTEGIGLDITSSGAVTTADVRGTLIESARMAGALIGGSEVTLEGVVLRSTRIDDSLGVGRGANIGKMANVTLRGSVVEQNHESGLLVAGATLAVEASVIRDTQTMESGIGGLGIIAQKGADLTVLSSLVERNHEVGALILGATATLESTVFRATKTAPASQQESGMGLVVQNAGSKRGVAEIRSCLLDANEESGLIAIGSDVTLVSTLVRGSSAAGALSGKGLHLQDSDGGERSNGIIHGCAVENAHDKGILVLDSDADIEATAVRSTQAVTPSQAGYGIYAGGFPELGMRSDVSIRDSQVEDSRTGGVAAFSSDLRVETSVIRGTATDEVGDDGFGIYFEDDETAPEGPRLHVRGCLVEENHKAGVWIYGAEALVESTVARLTQPAGAGHGIGIGVQHDVISKRRGVAAVRGCLVEQNREVGIFAGAADVTIESTLVRATQPGVLNLGWGIGVQSDPTGIRSTASIQSCLVEENVIGGIMVLGSDATVTSTRVRATAPDAGGLFGRGIHAQPEPNSGARSAVTVLGCRVDDNHDTGVFGFDADVHVEATSVEATKPRGDGKLGDGITMMLGSAAVDRSAVTGNARAGIASFGSTVAVTATTLACNAFDIEGTKYQDTPYSYEGSGGWVCTDKKADDCHTPGKCSVQSSGLEPPGDLPDAVSL